jgi:hypothetical protein
MIITKFAGIQNTVSPRDLSDGNEAGVGLQDAIDVDVTNAMGLVARPGYAPALAVSVSAAYTTLDRVTYIVSSGNLYRVESDLSLTLIGPSTATEFADEERTLFTNDGYMIFEETVSSIRVPIPEIEPAVTITGGSWEPGIYSIVSTFVNSDGLESGTSPVVTVELEAKGEILVYPLESPGLTSKVYMTEAGGEVFYELGQPNQLAPCNLNADHFPVNADKIEWYESKIFVTEPLGDYTIVWASKPFTYHLFPGDDAYFIVPGKVQAMKATEQALVIATDEEIYSYTTDAGLTSLAKYGVIPGRPIVKEPTGTLLIYTKRGVCRCFPFITLTEQTVSLPMGSVCATSLVYNKGTSKFVAVHDAGSEAFNSFDT